MPAPIVPAVLTLPELTAALAALTARVAALEAAHPTLSERVQALETNEAVNSVKRNTPPGEG